MIKKELLSALGALPLFVLTSQVVVSDSLSANLNSAHQFLQVSLPWVIALSVGCFWRYPKSWFVLPLFLIGDLLLAAELERTEFYTTFLDIEFEGLGTYGLRWFQYSGYLDVLTTLYNLAAALLFCAALVFLAGQKTLQSLSLLIPASFALSLSNVLGRASDVHRFDANEGSGTWHDSLIGNAEAYRYAMWVFYVLCGVLGVLVLGIAFSKKPQRTIIGVFVVTSMTCGLGYLSWARDSALHPLRLSAVSNAVPQEPPRPRGQSRFAKRKAGALSKDTMSDEVWVSPGPNESCHALWAHRGAVRIEVHREPALSLASPAPFEHIAEAIVEMSKPSIALEVLDSTPKNSDPRLMYIEAEISASSVRVSSQYFSQPQTFDLVDFEALRVHLRSIRTILPKTRRIYLKCQTGAQVQDVITVIDAADGGYAYLDRPILLADP